jgi:hypothetical protein
MGDTSSSRSRLSTFSRRPFTSKASLSGANNPSCLNLTEEYAIFGSYATQKLHIDCLPNLR